jgi:hypothetical protein
MLAHAVGLLNHLLPHAGGHGKIGQAMQKQVEYR